MTPLPHDKLLSQARIAYWEAIRKAIERRQLNQWKLQREKHEISHDKER